MRWKGSIVLLQVLCVGGRRAIPERNQASTSTRAATARSAWRSGPGRKAR